MRLFRICKCEKSLGVSIVIALKVAKNDVCYQIMDTETLLPNMRNGQKSDSKLNTAHRIKSAKSGFNSKLHVINNNNDQQFSIKKWKNGKNRE